MHDTYIKNRAPYVNLCHLLGFKSYGCKVPKIANFSNQFQCHLKVIEGHKYMNLLYFMNYGYNMIKFYSLSMSHVVANLMLV